MRGEKESGNGTRGWGGFILIVLKFADQDCIESHCHPLGTHGNLQTKVALTLIVLPLESTASLPKPQIPMNSLPLSSPFQVYVDWLSLRRSEFGSWHCGNSEWADGIGLELGLQAQCRADLSARSQMCRACSLTQVCRACSLIPDVQSLSCRVAGGSGGPESHESKCLMISPNPLPVQDSQLPYPNQP